MANQKSTWANYPDKSLVKAFLEHEAADFPKHQGLYEKFVNPRMDWVGKEIGDHSIRKFTIISIGNTGVELRRLTINGTGDYHVEVILCNCGNNDCMGQYQCSF